MMNRIFPLKLQMRGDTVADLQDRLRLLPTTAPFQVSDGDGQIEPQM